MWITSRSRRSLQRTWWKCVILGFRSSPLQLADYETHKHSRTHAHTLTYTHSCSHLHILTHTHNGCARTDTHTHTPSTLSLVTLSHILTSLPTLCSTPLSLPRRRRSRLRLRWRLPTPSTATSVYVAIVYLLVASRYIVHVLLSHF